MPKRPPKQRVAGTVKSPYSQGQIDAVIEARDRTAAGNPRAVRGAFLGGQTIMLGKLAIQPLTIGTFMLLEEMGSPLAVGSQDGEAKFSFVQLAEAALVLTDPRGAAELLSHSRAELTAAARRLAFEVPIADLNRLTDVLAGREAEAREMMPPPDAAAGKNPSVPPEPIQVSAGG